MCYQRAKQMLNTLCHRSMGVNCVEFSAEVVHYSGHDVSRVS